MFVKEQSFPSDMTFLTPENTLSLPSFLLLP